MDSANLTDTVVDIEKLLRDAVPPPVCEWQEARDTEQCGVSATWLCSLACGHSYYYCDRHKAERHAFVSGPGRNFCRSQRPPHHVGAVLADPVRFNRIASWSDGRAS